MHFNNYTTRKLLLQWRGEGFQLSIAQYTKEKLNRLIGKHISTSLKWSLPRPARVVVLKKAEYGTSWFVAKEKGNHHG